MSPRHHLIAAAYPLFKLAKTVGRPLRLASANSLRVLIYHDISPEEEAQFAKQLRWLARSWRFLSVQQFAALVSGDEPVRGHNLFLTFDDGFASQRRVAEQILRPMGIQALFFAVSDFVAIQDKDEARRFIARHIQPGCKVDELPAHLRNMIWPDLEALLEMGHSVGAHTRSHARLSEITAERDLEGEIVVGADTLARRLGISIEHFAYTFGGIESFSRRALEVARGRFRFIYSGLRGENARGVSPLALWREAVSAQDSIALLGGYVEGVADFYYARARAQLTSWV